MRRGMIVVLLVAMAAAWAVADRGTRQVESGVESGVGAAEAAMEADAWPAFLPPEAHDTLRRIDAGGPYDHRQDGGTFQNRERLLPSRPRGYYREYTVETPGSRDRGARRIVTGGDPPVEFFYTEDHYRSFRRFESRGSR